MSLPGGGEVEDLFVSAYKYYFLYSMYSMHIYIFTTVQASYILAQNTQVRIWRGASLGPL